LIAAARAGFWLRGRCGPDLRCVRPLPVSSVRSRRSRAALSCGNCAPATHGPVPRTAPAAVWRHEIPTVSTVVAFRRAQLAGRGGCGCGVAESCSARTRTLWICARRKREHDGGPSAPTGSAFVWAVHCAGRRCMKSLGGWRPRRALSRGIPPVEHAPGGEEAGADREQGMRGTGIFDASGVGGAGG
jgi:hypothetical protein